MLDCLSADACLCLASVLTLLRAVGCLCAVDANQDLIVAGTPLGAHLQVLATCLALAGVPTLIMANVGMHRHVGFYVRFFTYYLVGCVIFDAFIALMLPMGSNMCSALADPYVLQAGRIFVCSFINATYAFWAIVFILFEVQLVRKVHEQALIIEEGEFAQLLRYGKQPADVKAIEAR
mmetsp:Transcript_112153/g.157304  ORF Transcript_112153/g.157304 Transcript_112153/m.157304 type:complete len:178 (+) Transcript_112153:55-588(+)